MPSLLVIAVLVIVGFYLVAGLLRYLRQKLQPDSRIGQENDRRDPSR